MSGSRQLAAALLEALDDEALDELADMLAPRLAKRMDAPAAGRLLTPREVGERLGLHERTVTRMAAEGRLKGRKVGKGWRFHPDDLDVQPPHRRDLGEPPRAPARRQRREMHRSAVAAAIRG